MGRITKEQEDIISGFTCERLSYRAENRELIKRFSSEKGSSLVNYLHQFAWVEDERSETAFYLIKSSDNEIALFFSLKCGALFEPLNEEIIKQRAERAQKLLQIIQGINGEGQEQKLAMRLLEQFRTGQDIPVEQIKRMAKMSVQQTQELLEALNQDKENEGNKKIIRVGHTYPGVELVHFCANDLSKERWKAHGINHPMGEVLFWRFITPLILKVQEYVGCRFAFLFAADTSEDRTLINYYDVALRFKQPREFGTNKPSYDLCCEFMCEEIAELKENQHKYFDNFNPDEDDEFV